MTLAVDSLMNAGFSSGFFPSSTTIISTACTAAAAPITTRLTSCAQRLGDTDENQQNYEQGKNHHQSGNEE